MKHSSGIRKPIRMRFEVNKPDMRPAVLLDHVSDVAVNGLTVEGNPQAIATLRFIATRNALLSSTRVLKSAAVFLQVGDGASKGIVVDGGDLSNASTPLVLEAGATSEAVKLSI